MKPVRDEVLLNARKKAEAKGETSQDTASVNVPTQYFFSQQFQFHPQLVDNLSLINSVHSSSKIRTLCVYCPTHADFLVNI